MLLLHEKSATLDNEKPPKEVAEDHKKHLEDVMIRDSNPKFQVRSLKYYRIVKVSQNDRFRVLTFLVFFVLSFDKS